MLLGSEVVIVSIDDARKLVDEFLNPSCIGELQGRDILQVLIDLRDTIRRYDYAEGED